METLPLAAKACERKRIHISLYLRGKTHDLFSSNSPRAPARYGPEDSRATGRAGGELRRATLRWPAALQTKAIQAEALCLGHALLGVLPVTSCSDSAAGISPRDYAALHGETCSAGGSSRTCCVV
ncbi:uncharacterized protein O9250_000954 isoform 1-T1 [Rhynochetos jubatus]